jgi:hypothetical protein
MTDTAATAPSATVRFAHRPRRGFLLGFSGSRVACVGCSVAVMTAALFVGGLAAALWSAPLWIGAALLAFIPWAGRPAIETLPTGAHFLLRRSIGQTRYLVRLSQPRPVGTLALPGDAAALRFFADPISGAVMVNDPHEQTLTVVAQVRHPAYVLLSPDDQEHRVTGWGRALAGLAASGLCARVQVLETSLPDSGHGITEWWDEQAVRESSSWAVEQYDELMRDYTPAASTHRTLVALALDMKGGHRVIRDAGRGMTGAAAVLRQEMATFESTLRNADLTVHEWLDDHALASVLRAAYDPQRGGVDGFDVARNLSTAGPVGVEESWDYLRHDQAWSAVLWVSEWPRIDVPPSFLHALVFHAGVRKTISITATPLSTAQAMRDIRRAKVEYVTDAAQKAKIGAIADLADSQELEDVLERERALISGHADVRFTGLITVTAESKNALDSAVSQVSRAATQCGCETRRLCGQQARAFASAALPLARRVS